MEKIVELFKWLFLTPLQDHTITEAVIAAVVILLGLFLTWKILKYVFIGLKFIFRGIYNLFSIKSRCKKIQCPHCGRSLDRCVCPENRGKSNFKRLSRYQREKKNR